MHIQYLDLPAVPEKLIVPITALLEIPIYFLPKLQKEFFKTCEVNNELMGWLKDNMPFDISYVRYQIIYKNITIHKDSPDRVTAINYLLQTGGDNVSTAVYDDSGELLQSEIIRVNEWHSLSTNFSHEVVGVGFTDLRVAISIDSCENSSFFDKFTKS